MVTAADIVFLTAGNAMGLTGLILNSWIIAVNVKDYWAGFRLSPCDQILTLLGLTNLLLEAMLTWTANVLSFKRYTGFSENIHLLCIVILILLVLCNAWFTVWLSSYYCLKIVNFRKGILFTLNLRFSEFLPKLLIFSYAETLVFTVPAAFLISVKHQNMSQHNTTSASIALMPQSLVTVNPYYFVIVLIKSIILMTITLIPIRLTVTSLVTHVKRMKNNGFVTPPMEAHITATRTIILLVLFYAFFYVSCINIVLNSFNLDDILGFWFYVLSYPMSQSIVIITGNSKLRKAGKEMLNHLKSWRKGDF